MKKKVIGMTILTIMTAMACGGCSKTPAPTSSSKAETSTSSAVPLNPPTEENEKVTEQDTSDAQFPETSGTLTYQMAQIGTDSAVSEGKYTFDTLLRHPSVEDSTGITYHSLSFVVQIPGAKDLNPAYIQVSNRSTGENLAETGTSMLHVYESKLPTEEYMASHTFTPNNFLMSEERDNIYTLMLITTDDLTFDDLQVSCTYSNGQEEKTEELEFNSTIDNIRMPAGYTCQNSLLQLGNEYFVLNTMTSGFGGSGDKNKYASKEFVCISSPFTFSLPALNPDEVKICSKEDLSPIALPDGCEIYYEEVIESPSVLNISAGLSTENGGDYEAASELVYDSYIGLPTSNGLCVITGY